MPEARRFRIAVAGLGFGAGVHVPGLRSLPGVEVVALAGSSRERAVATAERLGVAAACGSVGELLDRELDAVSIALPPAETEDAVRQALDRGLAVLCEKPLGASAAITQALAQHAGNRTVAVDFQFAELASFRALRQLIDDGRLGPLRQIAVVWLTESYALRHRRWSWKTDAAAGGGVLNLLASHLLYLLEWIAGPSQWLGAALDSRATAAIAPPESTAAEDTAALTLGGRDGMLMHVMVGNAAPGAAGQRWQVVGERATALLGNPGPDHMAGFSLTLRDGAGGQTILVRDSEPAGDGRLPPFRALAGRFVDAARAGLPASPDFAAAARVQSLIEAARRAAADGRRITVG